MMIVTLIPALRTALLGSVVGGLLVVGGAALAQENGNEPGNATGGPQTTTPGQPATIPAGKPAMMAPAPAAAPATAPVGQDSAMPTGSQSIETPVIPRESWSFAGPFGKFDQAQLQRGYQIYREVCSNCHSMHFMAFRNLAQAGGPGFSDAQIKALSASFKVQDGPNDSGDMFDRPGRASDPFPSPFPNEQAARAANGGALPPDMSVLAKAREIEGKWYAFLLEPFTQYQEGGVDYIHGILNGYRDTPKDFKLPEGKYYNLYFPGHAISMPPPLSDGQVTYTDGSPQTLDQYSRDIAAFLMWVAEPKLDQRKSTGLTVVVFLIVFASLLYAIKRRIWAGLHDTSGTPMDHPTGAAPRA